MVDLDGSLNRFLSRRLASIAAVPIIALSVAGCSNTSGDINLNGSLDDIKQVPVEQSADFVSSEIESEIYDGYDTNGKLLDDTIYVGAIIEDDPGSSNVGVGSRWNQQIVEDKKLTFPILDSKPNSTDIVLENGIVVSDIRKFAEDLIEGKADLSTLKLQPIVFTKDQLSQVKFEVLVREESDSCYT